MKMHITKEWLMNNYDENDPDICTAGSLETSDEHVKRVRRETKATLLMFANELIEAARDYQSALNFGTRAQEDTLQAKLDDRHQAFKDFVEGMFE